MSALETVLQAHGIDTFGVVPFDGCTVRLPHKLPENWQPRGVILMALPYYPGDEPGRNVSLYAVCRDYHLLFRELLPALTAELSVSYPKANFAGFSDDSPLDERDAAARAGLGIIGDSGLLLTERYGSFVFLAELLTDLTPQQLGFSGKIFEIRTCEHCGACQRECPMHINPFGCTECLSYVTQKKKLASENEVAYIRHYGSAWGCDICQLVCPHNRRVIKSGRACSPLPFFREQRIFHLTTDILANMSEAEFKARAYAWKGRATVARNLAMLEEQSQ